jgi:hypothetical protein
MKSKIIIMNNIERLSEDFVNSILDDRILNKEVLKVKTSAFLKMIFDLRTIERGGKFKTTTLDFVGKKAIKNKIMSKYWCNKVNELAPEKMKQFYNELKILLSESDLRTKREKKFDSILEKK